MAVPFGVAFLWLGYSLLYYGYNRITGGNDKFVDLIYPGRYHPVTRDSGSGGPSSSSSAATIQTKGAAVKTPGVPKANPAPVPTIKVPGGKAKGSGKGPTTTPAAGLG